MAVDNVSNRNVTGRLKGLVRTDVSPLELTEALAERLNVRVQESIKEGRDRIDFSRVQAEELCYALSLLVQQIQWAQDELFPQHAASTLTNHALRDYDRWRDMYLSLRKRYRELAFKFVNVGSTLSPAATEVMFEELDRRLVNAVFKKRERQGQS